MSDVQDIIYRQPPIRRTISGGLGEAFGATSDMPSGRYTTGSETYIPVLRWDTGTHAQGMGAGIGPFSVVVTVDTSEPVIPGTTIPLYRISALLDGGLTIAEVKEDFPSLTVAQIVQVRDYARHHPNFGKQYPRKSLKRVLRESGFVELKRVSRKGKKRS
jgi:uncharacterized protein (DUF433 family)